jgi:hypothetical protein
MFSINQLIKVTIVQSFSKQFVFSYNKIIDSFFNCIMPAAFERAKAERPVGTVQNINHIQNDQYQSFA